MDISRIQHIINKTGDKIILPTGEPGNELIVMNLREYENLISDNQHIENLTEEELLDKINRDMAIWKQSRQDQKGNDNFLEDMEDCDYFSSDHEQPSLNFNPWHTEKEDFNQNTNQNNQEEPPQAQTENNNPFLKENKPNKDTTQPQDESQENNYLNDDQPFKLGSKKIMDYPQTNNLHLNKDDNKDAKNQDEFQPQTKSQTNTNDQEKKPNKKQFSIPKERLINQEEKNTNQQNNQTKDSQTPEEEKNFLNYENIPPPPDLEPNFYEEEEEKTIDISYDEENI